MEDQTPQKVPQIDRNSTANYTANKIKVVNNYYPKEESNVIYITVNYGQILLTISIVVLFGIMLWVACGLGVILHGFWLWLAKNWKFILAGLIPLSLVISATVYWFVTYTKDQPDKDLL